MSGLGDVLELIFARPDTWVPVHAVAREWHDRDVAEQVAERFRRNLPHQRMPLLVKAMTAPALAGAVVRDVRRRVRRRGRRPAGPSESELVVWLDATGRARVERVWAGGDAGHVSVMRLRGSERVWPDPAGQEWPAPDAGDVERLFDHRQLREILSELTLEHVRDDEVAGRPVLVVRAERRAPMGLWPHWLPFGADGYELLLDREHGHLLGIGGLADGAAYAGLVVTEITYGAAIDAALLAEP